MQPQPAAAAASRSSFPRGERKKEVTKKKRAACIIPTSACASPQTQISKTLGLKIAFSLFQGGGAQGREAGRLRQKRKEKQPFGMLPGEVTQGRQAPVGQQPSRSCAKHRELISYYVDAQRFPFLPGGGGAVSLSRLIRLNLEASMHARYVRSKCLYPLKTRPVSRMSRIGMFETVTWTYPFQARDFQNRTEKKGETTPPCSLR